MFQFSLGLALGELPTPLETVNLPSFAVETDAAVAIVAAGSAGLASGSAGNMPSSISSLLVATNVLSPTAIDYQGSL